MIFFLLKRKVEMPLKVQNRLEFGFSVTGKDLYANYSYDVL